MNAANKLDSIVNDLRGYMKEQQAAANKQIAAIDDEKTKVAMKAAMQAAQNGDIEKVKSILQKLLHAD